MAITGDEHLRGWWGMCCFNGLSLEQQHRLVTWGNLPIGYEPQDSTPDWLGERPR